MSYRDYHGKSYLSKIIIIIKKFKQQTSHTDLKYIFIYYDLHKSYFIININGFCIIKFFPESSSPLVSTCVTERKHVCSSSKKKRSLLKQF